MVEETLTATSSGDQTRPFELRILGAVEAIRNGEPLALGPRKQRALLARLVISANQVVSKDLLIEDLGRGSRLRGRRRRFAPTSRAYARRSDARTTPQPSTRSLLGTCSSSTPSSWTRRALAISRV